MKVYNNSVLQEVADSSQFDTLAQHITQSWEWGNFRLATFSVKKVLRLGSFSDGKLTRVFQLFIHKLPYLPLTIAYLPRSSPPTKEELSEIEKICRNEKAIFLKIEPIKAFDQKTGLPGKSILPEHSVYVDLTHSTDELFENLHYKTRYNIRLGQKKGVIVKEENTTEGLEKFINLLTSTESRQGFYSHYPEYYRKLWKTLSVTKVPHLLNAYLPHVKEPIASVMLFHFKNFLYYPYGGSEPEFREYKAPSLLHWEAIQLGKGLGCKTYDLWGTYKDSPTENDPWWGIYRFKSGFGGHEVHFPKTIDVPLSPFYKIFNLADDLRWQLLKLKRR